MTAKRLLKEYTHTIVTNDGASLAELLGVEELRDQGNFMFTGSLDGTPVFIDTEPMDKDGDTIAVKAVFDISQRRTA